MSEKDFRTAARRRFRSVRIDLAPRVRAALQQQSLMDEEFAIALNASQNVLREAMEVVFTESLPQQQAYFIELAVRLACYALTALPADDQEQGALVVRESLLNKLAEMQSAGVIIKTEWD